MTGRGNGRAGIPGVKPRPVRDRLLEKIAVNPETGCWEWRAHREANGYGRIGVGSKLDGSERSEWAHRISYEVFVGAIPEGLEIDHLCRNRACVNPGHLEAVTRRENTLRGNAPPALHARKTHCKNGHEFTTENTAIEQGKYRRCRACARAVKRRAKQRREEACLAA